MQNVAFIVVMALLGLGGLLNLFVVVLLTVRAVRKMRSPRVRLPGGSAAKLAAAHR